MNTEERAKAIEQWCEKVDKWCAEDDEIYSKNYLKKQLEKVAKEQEEERKIARKQFYEKHKIMIDRLKEKERQHRANRLKTDMNYKIRLDYRNKLNNAIINNRESELTKELLGCTVEEARKHLESQFKKRMSCKNHGKWHIDHIIPCAAFNLENKEEQRKCFHYTNLQPLWAKKNLEKSDKILPQYEERYRRMKESE